MRQLRRRCEARVRHLDIPQPFDVRAFCGVLASRRGRPIVLEPVAGPGGPFGLWVATPSADVIFYERDASATHQDHIILHELCHILCGHTALPEASGIASAALFSMLSVDVVRQVLRRAAYTTEEEREAEVLASLILSRALRAAREHRADADGTELLAATLGEG